jgi:hypothetical protein
MEKEKLMSHVLGYKPDYIDENEVQFNFINEAELEITWRGISRKFCVYGAEWCPIEQEDDEWFDDGYCFETEDLMEFTNFEEQNKCVHCDGKGYYEDDISHSCTTRMSDCCGGCTKSVICDCELFYPL